MNAVRAITATGTAIDHLLPYLLDQAGEVRAAVADVLSKTPGYEWCGHVTGSKNDLRNLAEANEPQSVPAIVATARQANFTNRHGAVHLIEYLLRHSPLEGRAALLHLLQEAPLKRAEDGLRLVHYLDQDDRCSVLESLLRRGSTRSAARLAQEGSLDAFRTLEQALDYATHEVRATVIESLRAFQDEDTEATLTDLQSGDTTRCDAALARIQQHVRCYDQNHIIPLLLDREPLTRRAASKALIACLSVAGFDSAQLRSDIASAVVGNDLDYARIARIQWHPLEQAMTRAVLEHPDEIVRGHLASAIGDSLVLSLMYSPDPVRATLLLVSDTNRSCHSLGLRLLHEHTRRSGSVSVAKQIRVTLKDVPLPAVQSQLAAIAADHTSPSSEVASLVLAYGGDRASCGKLLASPPNELFYEALGIALSSSYEDLAADLLRIASDRRVYLRERMKAVRWLYEHGHSLPKACVPEFALCPNQTIRQAIAACLKASDRGYWSTFIVGDDFDFTVVNRVLGEGAFRAACYWLTATELAELNGKEPYRSQMLAGLQANPTMTAERYRYLSEQSQWDEKVIEAFVRFSDREGTRALRTIVVERLGMGLPCDALVAVLVEHDSQWHESEWFHQLAVSWSLGLGVDTVTRTAAQVGPIPYLRKNHWFFKTDWQRVPEGCRNDVVALLLDKFVQAENFCGTNHLFGFHDIHDLLQGIGKWYLCSSAHSMVGTLVHRWHTHRGGWDDDRFLLRRILLEMFGQLRSAEALEVVLGASHDPVHGESAVAALVSILSDPVGQIPSQLLRECASLRDVTQRYGEESHTEYVEVSCAIVREKARRLLSQRGDNLE